MEVFLMSKFFSQKFKGLTPYTPGEQPQDRQYVKLNTNESPFPPSPVAQRLARQAAGDLNLYSDPDCKDLNAVICSYYGVEPNEVIFSNGSDDLLNFAFMAFCDENHPAVFPDITYGFYSVFAKQNRVPYSIIPLKDDFTIDCSQYCGINKTIFIANPNAPTGIALTIKEIESIVKSNPNSVVVVDEAYVDFNTESCLPLIHKYDNLLVVQTFSKSRSLAGGRLGMAFACKEIIQDLNTLRYSTNPYNVNRMTMAAGIGAIIDNDYFVKCCSTICSNRSYTIQKLQELGFETLPSAANFVFAKHSMISGMQLYKKLKENGVLIRHFETDRLKDYNRITIGNMEQMEIFLEKVKKILEDQK